MTNKKLLLIDIGDRTNNKIILKYVVLNDTNDKIIGEFSKAVRYSMVSSNKYADILSEDLIIYAEVKEKEKLAAQAIADAKAKEAQKIKNNENKKKIVKNLRILAPCALLLAAGLLIGYGLHKEQPGNTIIKTEDTNDKATDSKDTTIVVVPGELKAHDITETELNTKSIEVAKYLTSKGLSTDVKAIYSTIFIANMENIDKELTAALEAKDLISDSVMEVLADSLSLLGDMNTYNSTIANNAPAELDAKMISYVPFILANEKDRKNLLALESEYLKMVKANATDYQPMYKNIFDFYSGTVNNSLPYTQGEMSTGGLYLAKQGAGSQINEDAKKYMSDEVTKSFETPITDLRNEVKTLQDCGLTFSNTKTK